MAIETATAPRSTAALRRKLARSFLIAVVAMVLLAWFAPWFVAHTPLRDVIARRIFSDLNGTITVGEASLGWFSPLLLQDVAVKDADNRDMLTAPKIESSQTLLALLFDRADLGNFRFEKPALDIAFFDTSSNFEEICAAWLKPTDPALPQTGAWDRSALKVEFQEARVTLRDIGSKSEFLFDPVQLTFVVPAEPTTAAALTIEARRHGPDAGRINLSQNSLDQEIDGKAQSVGDLKLEMENLPAGLLAPFLRRLQTDLQVQGQLDGRLGFHWGQQKPGDDDGRIDGRLTARKLVVAGKVLSGDRLQADKLDLPCKIFIRGNRIDIQQAEIKCDLGQLSLHGAFDSSTPVLDQLSQPGWDMAGDIDLARLANMLPKTLRLQEDTRIQSGRLIVKLQSQQAKDGIAWTGNVKTTDLEGSARGNKLVWKSPLAVAFRGHREGKDLPVVDELRCDSGFLKLDASGSARQWNFNASFDLNQLSTELSRFLDLANTRLAGTGALRFTIRQGEGKAFTTEGESQLNQFELAGLFKQPWKESSLNIRFDGAGKLGGEGHHSLNSAELRLRSGDDELEFRLLEPLADIRSGLTGKANLRVRGDLVRWQRRLNPFVPGLRDWQLSGTGDVATTLHSHARGLDWQELRAALRQCALLGPGIGIREPALDLKTQGSWQSAAGAVELQKTSLTCPTLAIDVPVMKLTAGDKFLLDGEGTIRADLERLSQWFQGPKTSDSLHGSLSGPMKFQTRGARINLDVDWTGKDVAFGPAKAPLWQEPTLKIQGKAVLDWEKDLLALDQLKIDSSLARADAKGQLARLSKAQDVSLDGQLQYDLARLEPYLRSYFGKDFKIAGRDQRPFNLAGSLGADPKAGALAHLQGRAGLNWSALEAFGCKVGPAEVRGDLKEGWLRAQPIASSINEGKLLIEPSLRLAPLPVQLQLSKGTIVYRAKITREMCAGVLGYAAPALAKVTNADGLISAAVEECQVPLGDPTKSRVTGRLQLHDARFGTGPVVGELGTILLRTPSETRLAKESIINIRIADGKIHHDKLELVFPDLTVRTSGWVGMDGALGLMVEFPVPPKWVANRPMTAALAKTTIRVPMTGTLDHPRLDPAALRDASAQFARDLGKEILRTEIEDRLKKLFKK